MAAHIALEADKGKTPKPKPQMGAFIPSKATNGELVEEFTRGLLPAVRSRLIARDSQGRNVL